jgi:hypothetical protein
MLLRRRHLTFNLIRPAEQGDDAGIDRQFTEAIEFEFRTYSQGRIEVLVSW